MISIYLKKPDGTIQQFEPVDEAEAIQIKQALNLDKQLYAQRNEDFGEVYDAESLPDEDKITVGLMTQKELNAKLLAAANAKKIQEARQYLADTDYYHFKVIEEGFVIPTEILAKRAESRAIINELEA